MEYVTLDNGVKMPQEGYGVFQIPPEECERCVSDALSVGYRLIDTASSYGNEEGVGAAVRKSGIPRKELFITTKLWVQDTSYEGAIRAAEASMKRMGVDYLDLYLIHQPFGDYYGAWRAMEEMYREGIIRAIGVCNFDEARLVDLCVNHEINPVVNQVEIHPFHQQRTAKEYMDKYQVQIEAWAPFGEGRGGLFENPVLAEIGKKYGKTTAQVMLRWHLQRGVVVIPKSTHKERMKENFEVFDFTLAQEDMEAINGLDKGESSFFSHYDPSIVEWFVKIVEERKANHDSAKE